jgi:hypothetical protein
MGVSHGRAHLTQHSKSKSASYIISSPKPSWNLTLDLIVRLPSILFNFAQGISAAELEGELFSRSLFETHRLRLRVESIFTTNPWSVFLLVYANLLNDTFSKVKSPGFVCPTTLVCNH